VFYSVRTAGNGDTQLSVVDCMCPDASNAMDFTNPNIIER